MKYDYQVEPVPLGDLEKRLKTRGQDGWLLRGMLAGQAQGQGLDGKGRLMAAGPAIPVALCAFSKEAEGDDQPAQEQAAQPPAEEEYSGPIALAKAA
jgi:hypothetical protein